MVRGVSRPLEAHRAAFAVLDTAVDQQDSDGPAQAVVDAARAEDVERVRE